MKNKLSVSVVSDVMCPWCYIGKRRLEQAIENLGSLEIELRWLPFQLDATLPEQGKDRQQYLTDKFGVERAKTFYESIKQAGLAEGIAFQFDDIKISPNTLNSHRMIFWSHKYGLQNEMVEALFQAYFLDGKSLADLNVLADIAMQAGLDRDDTLSRLQSSLDLDTVRNSVISSSQSGISSVPTYIVEDKFAIVGAQPARQLADTLQKISNDISNN
ncbi:MAG: DsbA family oxidoreductase [Cohaesibacteraceae bacterium]|nr:DsbA family oxidoreductase [Cohaesibacteraceae bacterium]MBL4876680.1 DsbA family oxidoreductase [Cohaesibacteraceae bacterium]